MLEDGVSCFEQGISSRCAGRADGLGQSPLERRSGEDRHRSRRSIACDTRRPARSTGGSLRESVGERRPYEPALLEALATSACRSSRRRSSSSSGGHRPRARTRKDNSLVERRLSGDERAPTTSQPLQKPETGRAWHRSTSTSRRRVRASIVKGPPRPQDTDILIVFDDELYDTNSVSGRVARLRRAHANSQLSSSALVDADAWRRSIAAAWSLRRGRRDGADFSSYPPTPDRPRLVPDSRHPLGSSGHQPDGPSRRQRPSAAPSSGDTAVVPLLGREVVVRRASEPDRSSRRLRCRKRQG